MDPSEPKNTGTPSNRKRRSSAPDRHAERFDFDADSITLLIHHGQGSSSSVPVKGHDIAAGGMALLSRGFVHPGMKCEVHLRDLVNRSRELHGKVAWCDFRSGGGHLVGVEFEEPIDPRNFIRREQLNEALDGMASGRAETSGTVLVIDDEELDRELVTLHLRETPVTVLEAHSLKKARQIFNSQPIDLVITEITVKDDPALDLIEEMRSSGFTGPVLIATSADAEQAAASTESMGSHALLEKPYQGNDLIELITHCLANNPLPTSDDPIYSTLEDMLSLSEPVERFINTAKKLAARIESSIEANDLEAVRKSIRTLHANGEGFGFPIVSRAAGLAAEQLDKHNAIESALDTLRRVSRIVSRLTLRRAPDQKQAG